MRIPSLRLGGALWGSGGRPDGAPPKLEPAQNGARCRAASVAFATRALPRAQNEGLLSMGKSNHAKIVIIGSGAAGYTAAIYAARAMLEPILIQGIQPGGQLTITTDVENYPGFADVIQGPWLMEQMRLQATHVGTNIVADHVTRIDLSRRPFRLDCDSGDVYLAETLILA